jgi:hypothetical protein
MNKNEIDSFLRDQRQTTKLISERIRKTAQQLAMIVEDLDRFETEVVHNINHLSETLQKEA